MGLLSQTFTKQLCLEGIVFTFHSDKNEPLEFCPQNQWWTPQLFPLVNNSFKTYNKNKKIVFFPYHYNLIWDIEPNRIENFRNRK